MSNKSTALPAPARASSGASVDAERGRLERAAVLFVVVGMLATAPAALAAAPPRVRTVASGTIRIAYRATGSGRPLLLINGSGATLDTWDPALLDALQSGHRIIVFDPRGIGASTDAPGNRLTVQQMADDAADLLVALHIRRADVLGWSLGGFVAQEVAIRHGQLVRRLVLASSSPGGRHAAKATPKVRTIDEKTTIGLASPDEFLPILFPPAAQDAGAAWLGRLSGQPGGCCEVYSPTAGRRQVAAARRWYAASGGDEPRLGRISAPTLIAAGELDEDIPVADARLLHRRIKGSQIKVYTDAAHAFLIQHANKFGGVVQRFLQ